MSTNIFKDAEKKTKNVHKVGHKGSPKETHCRFCDNPHCNGDNHYGAGKKNPSQVWQSVRTSRELDWRTSLNDPNAFIDPDTHNDKIGKVQHAIRENPMVKGGVHNERAHTIGYKVRLNYEPDFEALGISIDDAMEFAAIVEDLWERDMEDPVYCWGDASGSQTFSEMMGLAFMECVGTGEILGLFFEEDKRGSDSRPMDTTFSFVDVSRLSTPHNKAGKSNIIHGRQVNKRGKLQKLYISDEIPGSTMQNRFTNAARFNKSNTHSAIKPFNEWNSPQAVHYYDKERTGQHRALPELASALKRIGMMNTFEETMLDAAVRDAAFAMWVESDAPNMAQAFSQNPGMTPKQYIKETMGEMSKIRNSYYEKEKLELYHGSGMIPQLMVGEKLNMNTPSTPSEAIAPFGNNMSTAIARALGVDPYTYTGRMEGVNFSTIRAALMQTWVNRRYKRDGIFGHIGTPIFVVWFEEKIARGEIKMPIDSNRTLSHLNFFYKNRRALSMLSFNGPGQEQIDQIKGFRAQEGALNCGLQTRTGYFTQFTDTTFRKAVRKMKYENSVLQSEGLGYLIKKPKSIGKASNNRVPDGTTENKSN